MKVCLTMKNDTEQALACARRTAARLDSLGVGLLLCEEDAARLGELPPRVVLYPALSGAMAACDVVVAVGGDGTIFHAAGDAMHFSKPVLGVNAGHLGFLAQLEGNDLEALDLFAAGKYRVESRLVLEIEVEGGDRRTKCYAVNDAVICKPDFGHVAEIVVRCGDDLVGTYQCDGIIFSTPTGSTAYSLSAGGPIADPSVDCMIMTPIASHSLISRSVVFAGDRELTVTTPHDMDNSLYLLADGRTVDAVTCGTRITIRKSDLMTRFVCLEGRSFYHILTEKMKRRG